MRKISLAILFIYLSIVSWQAYEYFRPIPESDLDLVNAVALENLSELPKCEPSDNLSYYYYQDTDWKANNKFGLYIYAEDKDYFEAAQQLVNSRGGDWGYVLIPFNVKDRDDGRWGRVFKQLRNKHLIPVIQLWDVDTQDYEKQTKEAAEFLNEFVWPIKYRYISVYNEVNDKNFWYGRIDPAEYAHILDYSIDTFKAENENFMMLNGAFNVSAPNSDQYMDSFEFMKAMDKEIPGIFNKLDAWASHSYPQPNFSGSPYAYGRWSVRAYEDELAQLKALGVTKDFQVFITETGWAHAEGENYNSGYLSGEQAAKNIETAYKEVWLPDDRVQAVMPFTIAYAAPYDHFSWIRSDGVPYKQYDVIKSLKKVRGDPPSLVVQNVDLCSQEY